MGLIYDDMTKTFRQQPKLTEEVYERMLKNNQQKGSDNTCPF